jgi:uncharacterized membrane protein YdjX (TVP38/TMEM64 family)
MPDTTSASGVARPIHRLPFGSRRLLLLLVLGLLLLIGILAEDVHRAILQIAQAVEDVASDHPVWAIVMVLLFTALSAMLAFVSSAVIAPFVATTWGLPRACLLLWAGWLLGGVLSYAVGRFLGRPVIRRLASPSLLARYEERISRHTPFGMVLLFQLALPSEIPGYLLGLVRYRFARYLLSLGLAELPYAVATVFLGTGIVERRVTLVLAVGSAAALLSAWTYHTLHHRLSRLHALEQHADGRAAPGRSP